MLIIDYPNISFFHQKLRLLMADLVIEFGTFRVTSLHRDDGGVHDTIPLRAIDLGCKNEELGRLIEKWMNEHWTYDPERPAYDVCLYHDTGQGIHLHIQVHDSTRKKQ